MISYQFIHFRTILRFAGIVTLLIALLMLIPGMYSLLVGESVYMSFAYSSALAFGFGLVLYIAGDRNKSEINKRDGFLTIFITWGSVALVGSLPFFLSGSANSYGDALFESIAGFSTNGLSLLDFNHTPASIVLWRGIIEWVGGIGIIIFIISFIPFFRSGQARVFFFDRNDETLGKITSSISGTARRLMLIYTGFTIVLLIILLALGLNLHDALLYTFSTMSTSGFSPLNGEVSHLSDAVLITISVFMFVAGSNLYLSYHLLKLRMKKIISNDEFRWYVLSIFIPLIFLMGQYFATEGFSGWHDTFPTTFNIVSIITTTGFYIGQNIPVYNHFWWIMLFLLMFLGSAAASSGGGINVFRQVVLFRSMRKYFLSIFHPNIVYKVRFNQIEIGNNTISRVMGFLLIYILVFVVGLLLLTLSGFGFEDSMAMSVAFLSNTGNAVRLLIVDFNMHNIEWYDKLIFAIMMLFGRLQIIPILIIVSPAFWKK